MSLLTKWSVHDIQKAVRYGRTDTRADVAIPNVAWGFFKNIEVDLLVVSRSYNLYDFEIKRSWEDFVVDFKKKNYHNDIRIKRLTYCLPDVLACEKLKNWCSENYKSFKRPFELLFYTSEGDECLVHPKAVPPNHPSWMREPNHPFTTEDYITEDMMDYIKDHDEQAPYRRPLFIEEREKLYRLAAIKAF